MRVFKSVITKTLMAFVTVLLFSANSLHSQDTLLLLNGKFVNGKVCAIDTEFIKYQITKGKKYEFKQMAIEDMFAIKYKDSSMQILYSQDTVNGYYYSVDEMYSFVLGENYARKYFKAPLSSIGGFVTGMAGGIVGFWGFTIPTAYTMFTGTSKPLFVNNQPISINQDPSYFASMIDISVKPGFSAKINSKQQTQPCLLLQKPFYEGYNSQAKDKKTKNAIKGGIIGFATLVVTSYILLSLK